MNRKLIRKTITAGVIILCLSGLFAGCKGKGDSLEETEQDIQTENVNEQTTNEQKESAKGQTESQEEPSTESNEAENIPEESGTDLVLPFATGWAVQKYKDQYLSYEIPESWTKNNHMSNDEMLFTFFQPKDTKTNYPSNVNVQITQLDTGSQPIGIDYGTEEIQEEFHQFMLSDMGLPTEATDGTFSVTQTKKGVYIYSLGFERKTSDNTIVHQTIYLPMNMEHSIVIWATDFKDGPEVSADEAAVHICETLEIVK